MKNDNTLSAQRGEAKETRAEKAIRLLTTMASSPFNQKLLEFRTFYPAVVVARANGMKNKQIIKVLTDGGLKLYPALFEKLVVAMQDDRVASTCPHCGQHMSANMGESDSTSASSDEACAPIGPEAFDLEGR
ncbi:MAG: hypothetical protein ABI114_14220 [Rhodanobacter sp.]